jgi:hypothetical protein
MGNVAPIIAPVAPYVIAFFAILYWGDVVLSEHLSTVNPAKMPRVVVLVVINGAREEYNNLIFFNIIVSC